MRTQINYAPEQLEALDARLQVQLPELLDEVARLLARDWPDYSRFLVDQRDELTAAGGSFIRRLIDVARVGPSPSNDDHAGHHGESDDLFEAIGRVQWQQGQDLTTLLTAYQVGARAAWWHVSNTALELQMDPEVLAALAESVFVFVGDLSSASARGYALQQYESGLARERLRDELTQLLLSGRSSPVAVRRAAVRAGWAMPEEAAVVLADPRDEVARTVIERAGSACLRVTQDGLFGLIVPDPVGPGQRDRLVTALRGAHAVVGHAVPLRLLPASVRIAIVAERLVQQSVLVGDPVFVDEHLDTVIVHGDDQLMRALRRQVLAPLDALTAASRTRLVETLTCWLRHLGDRQAVAAELHIHPQTVRYRLGQLRDVLGEAMDDPDRRARLFLAVAWGPPAED
ncbi:MAG: PucR family transcriptional regulator [Nocardioidaceae bacterium]